MDSDSLEFERISWSASLSCLVYASFGFFEHDIVMNSKQKKVVIVIFIDFISLS